MCMIYSHLSVKTVTYPASEAMEEFLDMDFGEISKSESDL